MTISHERRKLSRRSKEARRLRNHRKRGIIDVPSPVKVVCAHPKAERQLKSE
jgi:hypothetical protein